jgi:mannose/cellobiose epimerase-like protein (N-acyl-D-glucosamine 2-epimerase family)
VQILNEDDLRDCFAMFALAGAVMAGKNRTAEEVWQIADEMMEARKTKDEAGIASVKRTRKAK